MNVPNYFFADLPPEATLNSAMITEACQTLKRNRAQYLAHRSTAHLIEILSEAAENWVDPDYPLRQYALEEGPAATGFSRATLRSGLDDFFGGLNAESLHALLVQELGHAKRLDELVSTPAEQKAGRAALAVGPEFLVHITGGQLPNPVLVSIAFGLLVRSAQFVKCATGTSFIPRLFAHSIYELEPKLGACLEIAEWPGGNLELETALFAEADCVTATGSDATLDTIRKKVPAHARFIGYGHRLSFGFIDHEVLSGFQAKKIVAHAARDVVAWNQLGCLSPHVFYVEQGGAVSAEAFGEMLAAELDRLEAEQPRGDLSTEEAATIASRRAFYEVRAAHSPDTRHWCSHGSTAWTVIYEADPLFQNSCLNRFVYVKAAPSLEDALHAADQVRASISTVGLAAPEEKLESHVRRLAQWGATRICPLGRMQHPPLNWRHDGRLPLAELVRWADWEKE